MKFFWNGYTRDDWRDLRLEITSALLIALVGLGVGYYLGGENRAESVREGQKTLISNCIEADSLAYIRNGNVVIQCEQRPVVSSETK